MAVTREKFRKLAMKLMGVTFSDFSESVTFIRKDDFDYRSQTSTESTFEYKNCIVKDDSKREDSDYTDIQINDKIVLLEIDDRVNIRADTFQCLIGGERYDIISVKDIYGVIYSVVVRKM